MLSRLRHLARPLVASQQVLTRPRTAVFSSAVHPLGEKFIKVDEAYMQQQLIDRQRKFDSDPTNPTTAYKYFRELNRHQKFQTVIRLYERYETDYRTIRDFELQDKVRDQYSYATKNLEALEDIKRRLLADDRGEIGA